jgi:hypothetical protein
MGKTDEEWQELSKLVATCTTNMAWIKERLEKGDSEFDKYEVRFDKYVSRLHELETEHSLLKGRLGAFILGLTFIVSLLVNGILWAFSHFGSK